MDFFFHPTEGATISCGTGSYGLRVIVAALPAWWRFAQCMRHYYNTRNVNPHLLNAGKYVTFFLVVTFSAVTSSVVGELFSFPLPLISFLYISYRQLTGALEPEYLVSGILWSVGVVCHHLHLLHLLLGYPHGLESVPQHSSTMLPRECSHSQTGQNILI